MASNKSSTAVSLLEIDQESLRKREAIVARETDEQIISRIKERFVILDNMTTAVCRGDVRGMIVSGPPGVGKSFGVEAQLEKYELFNILTSRKPKYQVIKGNMSPLGLYAKLYEFSQSGNVIVFDDCDGLFFEDLSLNILKAALDSGERRWLNWNSDSRMLRTEGIPNRFEFRGGAVFITNLQFAHIKSKRLKEHLAAIESRCHILDLSMSTIRERILRIRQVVAEENMLEKYEFDRAAEQEVVDFIAANAHKMRELSLRMVLKVSDLRKAFPANWQSMATMTCMTH